MYKELRQAIQKYLFKNSIGPVLGSKPYGGPDNSKYTFVAICGRTFDINVSNANSTIRLGYCRAFEKMGIGFHLVSVFDVQYIIPLLRSPFIFLSDTDYFDLDKNAIKLLRKYPHFVWVSPDAKLLETIYKKHGYNYRGLSEKVYRLVLASQPSFVWSPVPPSALRFYSKWAKHGLRMESLPQACDTTRYYSVEGNDCFSGVKIAFVGGYWPKKAIQFDKYLKPYEDILTVYGYNEWPYKGYKGKLSNDEEKLLYQNARVSPAISELHAEEMGDIVERVFKIMGCGGLAIADVVPFYYELFTPDELLIPNNLDEYHSMIKMALNDERVNRQYRENGYKAIKQRHTYAHRAQTVLDLIGIKVGIDNHIS